MTPTAPASTRRFAAASLCASLLAAVALPGNRVGLGMALVAALVAGALIASRALGRALYTGLLLGLALGLASMAAVRAAGWVVAIDLTASVVLVGLAAAGVESWRAAGVRSAMWMARLAAGPAVVARSLHLNPGPHARGNAAPIARGLALGSVLVIVFGALFASADAAFAEITDQVLSPDVELGLVPARAATLLLVLALCGATVAVALLPAREPQPAGDPAKGSPEWVIALALLDALFVVFIVVQVRVLFGGDHHVLHTAGLGYGEYARQGFYQLLVVAFLTLGVVAIAAPRRGQRSGRRPTAVELLLGLLCALTLVVLVSALRRLGLVEDAYGFTVTRLLGHAATLWVGAVLAVVMVAGTTQRSELVPRVVVGMSAAGLLLFSVINPEGLVAGQNVERFERTGKLDTSYLAGLGPDATPALTRLPHSEHQWLAEHSADDAGRGDGFFELNVARSRAREAVGR